MCENNSAGYRRVQDPEVPVYLLRNVCYFCDSNGIQALASCFRESDPEILPCHIAHVLITICANVSPRHLFVDMQIVLSVTPGLTRSDCCDVG